MAKDKTKIRDEDLRDLSHKPTKVYLTSVMQKLFKDKWSQHLNNLLKGDRETLDLCADALSRDLSFFQLLHTLCLVTSTKHDLDEKDHVKAADSWLCWWGENKARIVWDEKDEVWRAPKP